MAEPSAATQSPSVSSSSGADAVGAAAGGGGSPGACPAVGGKSCASSCAEGLSSQCSDKGTSQIMTSFLSTSEICNTDMIHEERRQIFDSHPVLSKEGKDPFADTANEKMETLHGLNGNSVIEAPVVGFFDTKEEVHCSRPSIPTSFPEHPAFLIKETDPTEHLIGKDQKLKNQRKELDGDNEAASRARIEFEVLKGQKPHLEQSEVEGIINHSLSPSEVSGVASVEKDSPESPFEVIIDKATFDQEFKDSYRESSSWVMRTNPERAETNSQDSSQVFPLRNREERHYPASTLLTRQFSRTTAALEEVSRCVSDMHNFTNEVLTWDLVSQVKQPEKSENIAQASRLDGNEYVSEIPALHPKICAHQNVQKIPIHSIHESCPIPESGASLHKQASPDDVDTANQLSTKGEGESLPKEGGTLVRLPHFQSERWASTGLDGVTEEVALPDDPLKVGKNGQGLVLVEVMEADSSGESDDTVIEDLTTDMSFESDKRESEKPLCQVPGGVSVQAEEREITDKHSKDVSTKRHDDLRESVDDLGTSRVQSDDLEERPVSEIFSPKIIDADSSTNFVMLSGNMDEILPLKPVTTDHPKLSPEETSSVLRRDFMRDNKSDESPEDLTATLSETQTKKVLAEINVFEAVEEKDTDLKTTFASEVLDGVRDADNRSTLPNKSSHSNQLQDIIPIHTTPGASLDLEQEQLTIKALKELGGRQSDRIKPSQGEMVKATVADNSRHNSVYLVTSKFAPESSSPERSYDTLKERDIKDAPGLDFGIPQETSSPSKIEQVKEHFLTRLLTDFSVHDLIFWRDVKKTGFVFGTTLIILLSLAAFSVISVASYLILALLSVTISFRVYKSVIQAVQKSEEGHPFKAYLDVDITLSSEAFHNYVNAAMVHVNKALKLIIRLFLVEDLVDSLKLAVFMWLMTYVGAVFNGITLLILAELLVFSVPIVYEKYKTQIDHYVGIARDQTKAVMAKIQAKLPSIAKKKAE